MKPRRPAAVVIAEEARPLRNPAMFRDHAGILHPIRHSKDYDDKLADDRAEQRKLFGMTTEEDQGIREYARLQQREEEKAKREAELGEIEERLTNLEAERDSIREYLHDEPASRYTGLIRQRGEMRGEVGLIPWQQAKKAGLDPSHLKANAIHRDKFGRRFVRWEYALDQKATELGYPDGDAFKDAIEEAARDKKKLAQLEHQIAETRRELRRAKYTRRNPIGFFGWLDIVDWVKRARGGIPRRIVAEEE